ncbi:hypothetical protein BGZ83_009405 [Gryganskiella cystojenkinii]|nr:hypothetical protein BGZ83_009405 [Gryganskiella cystojenkinii]
MAPNLPLTMKAVQWTCPNKNRVDQLTFNESAPVPVPTGSQVLIKVHACAVNPIDWKVMKGGMPWHFMPNIKVPGWDVAGTVVALGPKAGQNLIIGEGRRDKDSATAPSFKVQVGDEILAMLNPRVSGSFQEYTVVDDSLVVKKPERWTFEQAAAWPTVAVSAWLSLVVQGKVKKGDKVLVNGASGGAGTVGVQMAKALGAHVVGVCSTANMQLVQDVGADEVVDYKTTDVTQVYRNQDFDFVYDTVGSASEIWANRSTLLKPTGNLVRIATPDNALDTPFHFLATGMNIGSKKLTTFLQSGPGYHFVSTFKDGQVLREAIDLLDRAAEVNPVIDSVFEEFSLSSVLEAFDRSEAGRSRGKIVIKVA